MYAAGSGGRPETRALRVPHNGRRREVFSSVRSYLSGMPYPLELWPEGDSIWGTTCGVEFNSRTDGARVDADSAAGVNT